VRAFRRPFLTVLGKFNPLNVVSYQSDPKGTSVRDYACFEQLCVKIHPFSRRVWGKN